MPFEQNGLRFENENNVVWVRAFSGTRLGTQILVRFIHFLKNVLERNIVPFKLLSEKLHEEESDQPKRKKLRKVKVDN